MLTIRDAERAALVGYGMAAPLLCLSADTFSSAQDLVQASSWLQFFLFGLIFSLCALAGFASLNRRKQAADPIAASTSLIVQAAVELSSQKTDTKTASKALALAGEQDGLFAARYIELRLQHLKSLERAASQDAKIKPSLLSRRQRFSAAFTVIGYGLFILSASTDAQARPLEQQYWIVAAFALLPLWWRAVLSSVLDKAPNKKSAASGGFEWPRLPVIPRRPQKAIPSKGNWHQRDTGSGHSPFLILAIIVVVVGGAGYLAQNFLPAESLSFDTATPSTVNTAEESATVTVATAPPTPASPTPQAHRSTPPTSSIPVPAQLRIMPTIQSRTPAPAMRTATNWRAAGGKTSRLDIATADLRESGRSIEPIRDALSALHPRLQQWYQTQRRSNSGLRGHIQIAFRIEKNGWVTHCQITEDEIENASFNSGLIDRVESLTFAAGAATELNVLYALHFRP